MRIFEKSHQRLNDNSPTVLMDAQTGKMPSGQKIGFFTSRLGHALTSVGAKAAQVGNKVTNEIGETLFYAFFGFDLGSTKAQHKINREVAAHNKAQKNFTPMSVKQDPLSGFEGDDSLVGFN